MEGWIKLHRKIRDNPIFDNMQLFRLWMICLTEATHKEYEQLIGNQMVKLEPGQFVTGRFELHEMYNRGLKKDEKVSDRTVWRWLEKLEMYEYLTIKSTNKFSIVTIVNWDKYQTSDHVNDQQMSNKCPTSVQQVSTNKNIKNNKEDIYIVDSKENIPYFEIISFLNELTDKSYKHTTKKTREFIKARWNEGFRLQDFKDVITKKTKEWKDDPQMNKYLRPETLFGTKFESYLNQADKDHPGNSDDKVTRNRPALVKITKEEEDYLEQIRRKQLERNKAANNW